MNAIPYDRPEEDWDGYEDDAADEALPGRPHRQFLNRRSAALIALIVGAIGFYAGVRVEKSQVPSSSTSAPRAFTQPSASGGARAAGAGLGARAAGAGSGSRSGVAALFGGGGAGGAAGEVGGADGNASFGTVSNISGNTFYVTDSSGNMLKVTLSSATKITKNLTVSKAAVHPGDTVVIRGLKGSGGSLSATSVDDSGASSAAFGGGAGGGSSGSASSSSASSAVGSLFGSGGGG